jgi:hypothetical protein
MLNARVAKSARSSAGKKMLNAGAAKNARAPAQASRNRSTHTRNAGKNAERAASKKETRACSEVTMAEARTRIELALLELRGEAVTTSDHRVYSMDRTMKSI